MGLEPVVPVTGLTGLESVIPSSWVLCFWTCGYAEQNSGGHCEGKLITSLWTEHRGAQITQERPFKNTPAETSFLQQILPPNSPLPIT